MYRYISQLVEQVYQSMQKYLTTSIILGAIDLILKPRNHQYAEIQENILFLFTHFFSFFTFLLLNEPLDLKIDKDEHNFK